MIGQELCMNWTYHRFWTIFFGECDPESKLEACLRQHLCLK